MKGKQLTALVEGLLMRYPQTRDSDKELIIGVLQAKGANLTPEQREIIRSISFESIRRTRQKFQEEGKYLASPSVASKRREKADIIKDTAIAGDKTLLAEIIGKPLPTWMDGVGSVV